MRLIIFSIFIFLSLNVFSQNALRFNNIITKDTIWLFENDKAIIQYNGYLSQKEEIKGRILQINDSLIILGSKFLGIENINKKINITDISGFRKYTKARRILKTSLNIIVIGGSIYAPEILNINSLFGSYSVSVGTGIIGVEIIDLIFSNKVKNTTKSGWKFKIMYPKT